MQYRAAVYQHRAETGVIDGEVVLTGPEHADMPEDDLIEEAVREAYRADLIGEEAPRITEEELRQHLTICEWSERR